MYAFNCDYLSGAHPQILNKLEETNLIPSASYGEDEISISAKAKIKELLCCDDAKIYFLVGGTQANYCVLDALLHRTEGVLAADTGHISVHEAGAIEYSGHKVLTVPHENGKLTPNSAKAYLESFYGDETYPHMVRPGAIYISHPSEYGTLYTKKELKELREICDKYDMKLYLDGARLAYALTSDATDVTISDIAELCDAFYIGGTKCGALLGEAVVFTRTGLDKSFFSLIKQHGALLAKGRMLGIQFDTLFSDGLYFDIGSHANRLAMKIKNALLEKGYEEYIDSPTNQQFFIIPNEKLEEIKDKVALGNWGETEKGKSLCRIATSWDTTDDGVEYLIDLM